MKLATYLRSKINKGVILQTIFLKPSSILLLKLHLVDGIILIAGKLSNTDIPFEAKQPILLPSSSYLTELLIKDRHARDLHAGTNQILTSLRQEYWIPKGRNRILNIPRKFTLCLNVQGKSYPSPVTSPLPRERCTEAKPFEITGVDYTGYINV